MSTHDAASTDPATVKPRRRPAAAAKPRANRRFVGDTLPPPPAAPTPAASRRLVGVATVQLPIVATGLVTPWGPLLAMLETWEEANGSLSYAASLPLLGMKWEHHRALEALTALHDRVVERVRRGRDAGGTEEQRAWLAGLVTRKP